MYRYIHLHNCANAPKKYMRHTPQAHNTSSLSRKYTITHTRTDLFLHSLAHSSIHSLTQSGIHSLIRSFTHSLTHSLAHIFSLALTLTLFVTSMLIRAHSHTLMHIHTLTHNYICLHRLTRSSTFIILFFHIYTHKHACARTDSHTQYMSICKFGYVCVRACVNKQMMQHYNPLPLPALNPPLGTIMSTK